MAIPREQVAHDLGLLSETGQSYHWQKGQYLNHKVGRGARGVGHMHMREQRRGWWARHCRIWGIC